MLTDLFLPGDSGIDLCRRIKADSQLRHLPVILLTRSANPVHLLRGLEAGADDFMTKDNEPSVIAGRSCGPWLARRSSGRAGAQPATGRFSGERSSNSARSGRVSSTSCCRPSRILLACPRATKQELARRVQAEDELRKRTPNWSSRVQDRTAELAVANRDLAQKNQENEMFVYSVSHDLCSPLVNLQGFAKELSLVGKTSGHCWPNLPFHPVFAIGDWRCWMARWLSGRLHPGRRDAA